MKTLRRDGFEVVGGKSIVCKMTDLSALYSNFVLLSYVVIELFVTSSKTWSKTKD